MKKGLARRHKLLIETAKRSWAGANIQKNYMMVCNGNHRYDEFDDDDENDDDESV